MGLDRRINQTDPTPGDSSGAGPGAKRRLHLREVSLAGSDIAELYDGVGASLASARTDMKLDLDRVASDLRIRRSFIEAIESGRFDALPGQAYTQGFVRSYATYLKLDPEDILERLRDETRARRDQGDLVFPTPVAEARLPGWQLVVGTVAVAALVYIGWISSTRTRMIADHIPPVPEQLLPHSATPPAEPPQTTAANTTPAAAPTLTPAPISAPPVQENAPPVKAETPKIETPKAEAPAAPPPEPKSQAAAEKPQAPPGTPEPAPASKGGRVFGATDGTARIVLRATGDTWVRVTEPGGTALLRRILRAGDAFHVPNRPDLELAVGNAAAIELIVDGETVPTTGTNGEVLHNIPLVPETLKQGLPRAKRIAAPAKREKPASPPPESAAASENQTPPSDTPPNL